MTHTMKNNIFLNEHNVEVVMPKEATVVWRPSVYGMLKNDKDEVLMITATVGGIGWEFPGGGMNFDETPQEALEREFYEETGYRVRVGKPLTMHTRNYLHRDGRFCRSLLTVFEVSLVSDERNAAIVNTVDGDEIASMEWVPLQKLTQETCHPMFRAVLEDLCTETKS